MNPSPLLVDRAEIGRFVEALFRYADDGSYANLRAFYQKRTDGKTFLIKPSKINGKGLAPVIEMAAAAAQRSANAESPVVFAPPIATFAKGWQARRVDIVNGLSLSVEVDDVDPDVARTTLEAILGRATVIVASGSDWTDAETGEIKPKVHLHWRLSEPTRTDAEHDQLHDARKIAMRLVGADPTGAPAVHPLRWPGSWNTKASPRMARIAALNEAAEVHLNEALERLQEAEERAGLKLVGLPIQSGPAQAPVPLLRSAMAAIPNPGTEVHYDDWISRGYACWHATGGTDVGFEMWDDWSRKSDKYDNAETFAAWERIAAACRGPKPPRTAGAGSIFHHAVVAGWKWPKREKPPPHPGEERASSTKPANDDASRPDQPSSSPLPVVYFNDIRPSLDCADFVEGVFTDQSMAVIYGQSNSGKTFWLLNLALHVAAGMKWEGRHVERRGVLWLAMEGSHGAMNRVEAWRTHHGFDGSGELPFAIIPVSLNLLDPAADTDKLIETIQHVAARFEIPVGWIIVDTLSRAMAGGNENAPDDMGALVTNGTRIQQETKAAVAWIHHAGKDDAKGARGHSLLRAATDTEIEITATDMQRSARVTKQREMDCAGEFPFKLEVVSLGVNKRGKPVTSCVVVGTGEGHTAGAVLSPRLKGHTRRALDVLHDLLVERGKGGYGVPDGCLSVPEDWWRERFYDRTIGDGPDTKQDTKLKAFRRAVEQLQELRLIGVMKGRVWAVRIKRQEGEWTAPDPDI